MSDSKAELHVNREITVASALIACPFCRKRNKPDGRYCIHCGSILKPVYCSSCGTSNPEDLAVCLECGNQIPSLTGIRWNPIVTIIQPTSAMAEEVSITAHFEPGPILTNNKSPHRSLTSRIRARLSRKEAPPIEES